MRKYFLLLSVVYSISSIAQTGALLPGYNSAWYPSVLSAAKGVAMPFLLQQGFATMAGVTIVDSTLIYAGVTYQTHENYVNPSPGYYVNASTYGSYGITGFSSIWPTQFPNILYNSADTSFNAQADCVGYLTRLLSATGDTSADSNAYLNIINTMHAANTAPFAYTGYVATAYSFAIAFPTLPTAITEGWEYVAGNVEQETIDTYNHTLVSSLGTYNGVRKGGFAAAQPGDILALGYSAASSSNGHVMVMETAPRLLNADSLPRYFPPAVLAQATALLTSNHIYSLPVFDCSGQYAHYADSRVQTSGIGHGTLLVMTSMTDDAPTGTLFDSLEVTGSTFHFDTLGTSTYAISVGRFVTPVTASTVPGTSALTSELQVYPNPSDNELHITLPAGKNGQLTISTAEGQTIISQSSPPPSLSPDVSKWPDGLYIIRYQQENGNSYSEKWIKQ